MPKGFDNLLTVFFLAVLLAGLVLYLRPDAAHDNRARQAVSLVTNAQKTINENGIVAGLSAFDREADFHLDRMYLLVRDRHGEVLYHGADRTRVGENFKTRKDADRRPFGQKLLSDQSAAGVWHSRRTAGGWQWAYARADRQGHIIAALFPISR